MNDSEQLIVLQQAMKPATLAWGLVAIPGIELSFANPALQDWLRALPSPSSFKLEKFEQVRQAVIQCLQTGQEVSTDLPGIAGRWHFSPLEGLARADTVQCYVLPAPLAPASPEGGPAQEPSLAPGLGQLGRFETFLDHLPFHVWIATPHGELTWLNRSLHEYAYQQAAAVNLRDGLWIDIVHPDDMAVVNTSLSRALITEQTTGYRLRVKRHDGQYQWFFASLSPVKDSQGQTLYWVGANLNIDSLRQSEVRLHDQIALLAHQLTLKQQTLEQAEAYLAQVQKINVVHQISAGVVHDVKNLLFISSLHAGLLERQLNEPQQREHVNMILNTIQKAGDLASHLTGFSSRKSVQLQAADPRELVMQLEPLLNKAAGQDGTLTLITPPGAWLINVDKLYFENSLINLCINARDATAGQGQITVAVENVLLERSDHTGEHVKVSVRDNGCGMSEEVRSQVFEMFFSTKAEGKGAGLGLPMVKNFMDHSHGLIDVESAPGKGTTVSLYFPRAGSVPQKQAAPQAVCSKHTVLLIEPDLATRNAMAQALYEMGHEVVTAYLPQVALRYLRNGLKVDLIIASADLPQDPEEQGMQQLRTSSPGTPFMLTCTPQTPTMLTSLQHNDRVLTRPVNTQVLGKLVGDMLRPRSPEHSTALF